MIHIFPYQNHDICRSSWPTVVDPRALAEALGEVAKGGWTRATAGVIGAAENQFITWPIATPKVDFIHIYIYYHTKWGPQDS